MISQKMSLLAVVGVLVVAAGAFIWQSQSENLELPGLSNTSSTSINQTMSFSQLMQLGENYTCTFSDSSEEDGTISGTAYVAASINKFRTDFITDGYKNSTEKESDSEIAFDFQNGSIISDGEFVYVWNSESNEGFKMKFDPDDSDLFSDFEMESEDDETTTHPFDQNQEMEYDCKAWKIDDTLFVPPANIDFIDFSAQSEQIESMMNSIQLEENIEAAAESETNLDMSEMCSICSQLPAGEAQTECMASLGC